MNTSSVRASVFTRALIGLYVVSFASGFSMGIFNPLISLLMEEAGVDQILIGANSSLYYLVIALAAPLAAKFIKIYNLRSTIFVGIALTTITTALFPYTQNIGIWFLLRIIMGIGVCLYMIAGQTGLNTYASSERRGLIVAIHGSAFGVAFMISPAIGCFAYSIIPKLAFVYSAAAISLSVFAVLILLPKDAGNYCYSFSIDLLKKISIPLHGVFIYGILEGILVTLLPIIMIRQAIEINLIGLPITLFMVASGLGMIPVAFFGDKFGRARVIYISSLFAIATLLVAMLFHHPHVYLISAILLGLSLGTFFPVTLAMIGETLRESEMHNGSGMFTGAFSLGCAVGPLSATLLMTAFGENHLFTIIVVFLIFLVLRMTPYQFKSAQPITNDLEG